MLGVSTGAALCAGTYMYNGAGGSIYILECACGQQGELRCQQNLREKVLRMDTCGPRRRGLVSISRWVTPPIYCVCLSCVIKFDDIKLK